MLTRAIFERAARTPDKLALIGDGVRLSYGDFARRIDGARGVLAPLGLPVDRVAVLCIHSLTQAWVVGLALRGLGVTTLAARSFEDVAALNLANLGCVITTQAQASSGTRAMAAAAGWALVVLEPSAFAGYAGAPPPALDERAPPPGGHILLTSGTTGSYKKVLIDPASEAGNIPRRSAIFGVSEHSLVNLFDFGGWTSAGYNMAVCAWGVGGAVAIGQDDNKYRSLAWGEFTHCELHPEMLQALLAGGEGLAANPAMAMIVISGGLPLALWEEAKARLTPRIFTCVSSTETGPFTLTLIESADDLRWHRVHPSREVEIVDEAGALAPNGTLGRVRVRLVDQVSGYLDDPLTSAGFFADGCFYTGDLGVFRADGRLALHGRVTEVINVLGNKLAAAPIEEALRDRFGAQGVCVFSMQGADGGEEVHVAIQSSRVIDQLELAAVLRGHLRGFARAHVHFVAQLPRSPAGKIDRLALRRMVMGGAG